MSDKVPIYHSMVASRTLDGEAIIVQSRTRRMHVLDEVGTFIWELVERGESPLDEITSAVERTFDVDGETARLDVEEFILKLEAKQLVSFKES